MHNSFILYSDQFHYGGTVASIQLPVSERAWMVARGGGGTAGYGFGEVGLRILAKGQGDRGSLFITPVLGGAALHGEKDGRCDVYDDQTQTSSEQPCVETVTLGGPMVGAIVELRL